MNAPPIAGDEPPFGGPLPTGWRAAPDCGRCNDRGRFSETRCNEQHQPVTVEAHCTCKRGRRMSELWYAEKHGLYHPDMPEPEPPDEYEEV